MVNPIDLPPMPDSITGEPRPPRAPHLPRHGIHTSQALPTKATGCTGAFRPHPRMAPATLRDQYGDAAMLAGLLAVFGTISAGGFSWVLEWWAWGLLALFPWIMFRASGNHWTAAGVSWVQWRDSWVDTYKLTRIQFSADGYSRVLRLKDAHGNEIHSFKISEIQRNPDLWDLVYNGILHSVASGNCDIDAKTRHILKIPYELGPRPTRSERIRGRGRRG